jgi:hypothetical protein
MHQPMPSTGSQLRDSDGKHHDWPEKTILDMVRESHRARRR